MEKQVNFNNTLYTRMHGKNRTKHHHLAKPFPLNDKNILNMIRQSPLLYNLYEEDHHNMITAVPGKYGSCEPDKLAHLYGHLHMLGAIGKFLCHITSLHPCTLSAESLFHFVFSTRLVYIMLFINLTLLFSSLLFSLLYKDL